MSIHSHLALHPRSFSLQNNCVAMPYIIPVIIKLIIVILGIYPFTKNTQSDNKMNTAKALATTSIRGITRLGYLSHPYPICEKRQWNYFALQEIYLP